MAIHSRHGYVREQEIERFGFATRDRLSRTPDCADYVTGSCERGRYDEAYTGLIIDYEYSSRGLWCGHARLGALDKIGIHSYHIRRT
jgi:hypothetical protein